MTRRRIDTNAAPTAVGAYSQGIAAGDFLFCAGQVGMDPATGELVPGGTARQVERALENVRAVLDAGGMTLGDVVKTTVFLADLGDFAIFNETYGRFFPDPPPARSTFQVAALPRGAAVEIEAIAWRPRS